MLKLSTAVLAVSIAAAVHAGDFDDGMKALERGDYARALVFFQRAASAGDAAAERSIGFIYYRGQGVPQDIGVAEAWFTRAAEHGDLQSQVNLAMMYENGLSIRKDAARSAYWFLRAADRGDRLSQVRAAEILYLGDGVAQDYVEAAKWWKIAMGFADDDFTARLRPRFANAESKLSAEQLAEASRRASAWKAAAK